MIYTIREDGFNIGFFNNPYFRDVAFIEYFLKTGRRGVKSFSGQQSLTLYEELKRFNKVYGGK